MSTTAFKKKIFIIQHILFYKINLFLAVLGLCCCTRASSGCVEQCHSPACDVQASYCSGFSYLQHKLYVHGLQLLWCVGPRWWGPSCSVIRGIFLDQGWNSCPLNWQAGFVSIGPPGKSCHHCIVCTGEAFCL